MSQWRKMFQYPYIVYYWPKLQAGRFRVYIFVYQITKIRALGLHNSLRHADNKKYFSGLSPTRNRREAHIFHLGREEEKIWRCFCQEKCNFIMISEFKYGQTWKIWPSPLSLSIYSTIKYSFYSHISEAN